MKSIPLFTLCFTTLLCIALPTAAEGLRCKGDIVEIGDSKADVMVKCGAPQMTDAFCEKVTRQIQRRDGTLGLMETCDNVDVWTYNPGKGQFWTHLYFSEGKLDRMKYGERVQ